MKYLYAIVMFDLLLNRFGYFIDRYALKSFLSGMEARSISICLIKCAIEMMCLPSFSGVNKNASERFPGKGFVKHTTPPTQHHLSKTGPIWAAPRAALP